MCYVGGRKNTSFDHCYFSMPLFGIPRSQIEIEWIFSIDGILTAFCRCHLQIDNLDKLISVNKNWPSDPQTSCVKPSNLASRLWGGFKFNNKVGNIILIYDVDCEDFKNLNGAY